MNILFIYERKIVPSAGGVERVTILLAREMKRRGHNVSFLSVGVPEWNQAEGEYGFPQYFFSSSSVGFAGKVASLFGEIKPDAVILQGFHSSVLPVLPLIPNNVRKLMVFHNQPHPLVLVERYVKRLTPWHSLRLKGKLFKSLALVSPSLFRRLNTHKLANRYRRLVDSVDYFVLLSDRYIPRFLKFTPGVDPAKIVAVNNPNTFAVEDKSEVEAPKENIVLFVGRLSNPQKNVTGFLDVWKRFYALHPDWKAMVLGDGEHRREIEAYATRHGVKGLSFEGNREDIAAYYRRAKLLCMTSTYEGWPMVLAEAMSYGCVPVVYDSFEAASDLIESGVNGVLIKPFDAKAMSQAMSIIASDEPLRLRMAAAGRRFIRRFSVEAITDRWLQNLLNL